MAAPHDISYADWQKHKQTICRLNIDQNMPMNRLRQEMSSEHGFNASKSQYMRQFRAWRVRKNQKGNFWKDLSLTLKRRGLTIDEVDIFLKGELVPNKKLRRQLPRHDLPTLTQTVARPRTPDGIFIRPRIQLPRALVISLPWHQMCTRIEMAMSSLSRETHRSPSPLPSTILDVTDGLFGLVHDEYYPSLGFVDDGTVWKTSRDSDIVNASIAGLLNLPLGWTSRESVASIMAQIAPYMPERYLGETESVGSQLIGPNSTTRMQVFTSFMALMLANGHLQETQVDAFVIGLDEVAGSNAFEMLPLRDDPSTRAVISELLFAAVRMDLLGLMKSAVKNRVNVNCRSTGPSRPKTLILEAVGLGRVRIVELLIDAGADITPRRMNGRDIRVNQCPVHEYSAEGTASEFYQLPGFYCLCETSWAYHEFAISRAASSRNADEIIPLLLKSQLSTPVGTAIIEAIRNGASKETVEMLIRNGASVDESSLYSPVAPWPDQQWTALCVASWSGDTEMVRLLLNYGADPNGPITCRHGRLMEDWAEYLYKSPLVVAVECGDFNTVKLLVEHGADPNWSVLDVLEEGRRAKAIRELLDSRYLDHVDEYTQLLVVFPLQAAAGMENPEITRYLLSKGATANLAYGTPPLSIAAYHGRNTTVDLLIRGKAMINSADVQGCGLSALQGAVCSGSEDMVQRMISAGADLDWCSSGNRGGTALQRAAKRGFGVIFDMLRRAGARLDSSSVPNHATTILEGFIKHHDYEGSLGLLQDGISPNAESQDRPSPLTAAILNQDSRLLSLLLDWGADANGASRWPLPLENEKIRALHLRSDLKRLLLTESISLLHCAAAVGNLDAVVRLGNAGADVNKPSISSISQTHPEKTHGFTPLHMAVGCKRKDIVQYLLAQGADVNSLFPCEHRPILSPIINSVANSDPEITTILLRHGADPYLGQLGNGELQEDERLRWKGRLALEEACTWGDIQMVRLLISSKVDVHVGYPLAFTFDKLIFIMGLGRQREADAEQRAEIMELLLANGVDVNHRHARISTPLQAALKFAQDRSFRLVGLRCARRLVQAGAEINAVPSCGAFGRTALQAAVETGDIGFIQHLLSKGAEVNAPAAPDHGVTALQAAAIEGYLRIAQILLEHGAEVDADPSPYEGRRAIDGAAEWGRIDMVKLLLDNYNGPRPISKVCESAMEYAERNKQWYMMEFLESYMPPTR